MALKLRNPGLVAQSADLIMADRNIVTDVEVGEMSMRTNYAWNDDVEDRLSLNFSYLVLSRETACHPQLTGLRQL